MAANSSFVPDVSVIAVTYHSAAYVAECLDSIRAQQGLQVETIVVDNASTDGTVEAVRRHGGGVVLLPNQENIGFGRACNQGFAASQGRYIYLLNPDAKLVGNNALARLVSAMEEHPRWGIAGTRVLNDDGPCPPSESYPGQAHVRHEFDKLPGRIAWVLGASMFFRREVFAALKGFDPDYFLYSEEIDLCLRLRKHGHEIGYVEDVEVRHIGGASERGRDPYEVWARKTNGIHLFWRKHYRPEDAEWLVRRDRFRARYRMIVNGLLARLGPAGSRAWEKHRRYRAIWDTSRAFLSNK